MQEIYGLQFPCYFLFIFMGREDEYLYQVEAEDSHGPYNGNEGRMDAPFG